MQALRPFGWRGWIWPLLIAGLIVFASSRSQIAAPEVNGIDKVGHFLVFGLLATLIARNGFRPSRAWMAVALVSAFGATDEWHQSFTPGRSVEVADWLADTAGAALAVALYAGWSKYRLWLERPLKRRVENSAAIPPNGGVA